MEMNEQAIKVLARFTPLDGQWPIGAWVYMSNSRAWLFVKQSFDTIRLDSEISELEANQRGIFRDKTITESYDTRDYTQSEE
jgi:hypothetical protein